MEDKDFIDVEFTHNDDINDSSTRVIAGEPLFYTTTQCADMVGVEASTIRYWSKRFENLLDIEVSNRNRQYKKSDVLKLQFIKKLAYEDGLTLQQIEDYTTSKGFDIDDIEKGIVDGNNPLAIQTFVTAALTEMDKKLNDFADMLLSKVNNSNMEYYVAQQESNKKLQEDILVTVDEILSESQNGLLNKIEEKQEELKNIVAITIQEEMKNTVQEFKSHIDERELEYQRKDQERIDFLNNRLEEQRQQYLKEQEGKSNNKGFFSKLFGK